MRGWMWVGMALVVIGLLWWATRNRLTVVNSSGQAIHSLTVEVGGEVIAFGDLPEGISASAHFWIEQEEVFEVCARLADGTEIKDSCGYVVWEEGIFGVEAVIAVQPGGELRCSH